METNLILCPRCGRQLAQLLGEIGQRRRLKTLGGARVRMVQNALGEDTASIKCPKCEAVKPVDPAHWLGPR
jgi:hypothetical protein